MNGEYASFQKIREKRKLGHRHDAPEELKCLASSNSSLDSIGPRPSLMNNSPKTQHLLFDFDLGQIFGVRF